MVAKKYDILANFLLIFFIPLLFSAVALPFMVYLTSDANFIKKESNCNVQNSISNFNAQNFCSNVATISCACYQISNEIFGSEKESLVCKRGGVKASSSFINRGFYDVSVPADFPFLPTG